eukprot:8714197-Ditylum_brightwellii.AAC.1
MLEKEAWSNARGHFFLNEHTADPGNATMDEVPLNSPIHTVCEAMRNIMTSSAEAEIGTLCTNMCKGEELQLVIEEMGHKQPPIPIMTDNSTACGIINKTVKQRRMHAIDMHFYWVCNRVAQNHFIVYWSPGKHNLVDYHTKHHPELNQLTGLRGCVSWVESRPMGHESTLMSHGPMALAWAMSLEHMMSWSANQD